MGIRIEYDSSAEAFLRQCAWASDAGFAGIELAIPNEGCEDRTRFDADCSRLITGLDELRTNVITLSAVACGQTLEEASDAVGKLLELTRRLGGRCLNLILEMPGMPAGQGNLGDHAEIMRFSLHLLRRVGLPAERAGVSLAVEGLADKCPLSPMELRDLVDRANGWPYGVCVDVARAACPQAWLHTLRQRVRCIRIPGRGPGDPVDKRINGESVSAVLPAGVLDEIQYDGPIILTGGADVKL